ncbi:MAG: DUF3788 family protein [Oscillospiraceae bacterium]
MEEIQLLRDAATAPTDATIAKGLGAASRAYTKFIEQLEKRSVTVNWRYYNDGKAWLGKGLHKWATTRGTPKEATVFWLSIWQGFFKVSIFIPEKARSNALALPLGAETKKMIQAAKQMGKLKFFALVFNLQSDELFEDIDTLIDFRKALK